MVCKNWIAGAVLAVAAFAPDLVRAQGPADLLLPVPTAPLPAAARFGRASPGVSSSSPLAFGPSYRDVFAGVGYQAATRFGGGSDGTFSMGFGLGNPTTAAGVEVVLTSLSTVRSGMFSRTGLSLKVNRILPGNTAVAAGIEGVKLIGPSDFQLKNSVYAVATHVFALRGGDLETPFSSLTLNGGLGNGRYCAEASKVVSSVTVHYLSDCSLNFFASAGLRANKYAGLIADWTGQDLNLGVSLAVVPNFPLVITPALADVMGTAGDKVRFTLGAGFGLHF